MRNIITFKKSLSYLLLTLMFFSQYVNSMFYCNSAKVVALIIIHTGSSTPKKILHYCLFKNDQETMSVPIFDYHPLCQPESPSSREKIFVQLDETSEKEKLDLFILQYFKDQISEINIVHGSLAQYASIVEKLTNNFLYRYEINLVIDSTKIECVKKYLKQCGYELVEINDAKNGGLFDNPIFNLYKQDPETSFSSFFNNQRREA